MAEYGPLVSDPREMYIYSTRYRLKLIGHLKARGHLEDISVDGVLY
jgi:hypothetical protein